MLIKKDFKGRNGKKATRHYDRYVMGADIKACILTVPTDIRFQLSFFLTNKRMNNDFLQRRMIIHNDCYLEDVDSSTKNI